MRHREAGAARPTRPPPAAQRRSGRSGRSTAPASGSDGTPATTCPGAAGETLARPLGRAGAARWRAGWSATGAELVGRTVADRPGRLRHDRRSMLGRGGNISGQHEPSAKCRRHDSYGQPQRVLRIPCAHSEYPASKPADRRVFWVRQGRPLARADTNVGVLRVTSQNSTSSFRRAEGRQNGDRVR